ncbi:hypothetical protein PR202_ga17605 [Eleusine coracana subsp. coracana]|uniref:Uncharacterized protein n=1 Tax=Eleusine coracana subsp. coracana TaxID=191504 RepID=A0AAV5CPS9_ELECO|nr:hypothetical protein PR202_ga17358 [Eleusine coracana subsp. coracana]GJN00423.1 hypothetical protein PR202_ga17605 [Eleusine coracana subsp. coracana]
MAPAASPLRAVLPTAADCLCTFLLPKNYIMVRRHRTRTWVHHVDAVTALAVSLDGLEMYSVSWSWDRSLKAWHMDGLLCVESVTVAHDDAINAVAVSPDGHVFTSSADKTIKAWRGHPRQRKRFALVGTMGRHEAAVNALANRCSIPERATRLSSCEKVPAAVLRVQAPADHMSTHFAAMDSSKMVIMHTLYDEEAPPAFVYDTVTAALAVGPRPSPALQDGFDVAVAVAGKLYTLKTRGQCQQHSFEVLSRSPPRPGADADPRWSGKVEEWFWSTVASRPPFDSSVFITGYAVHPDGRTIFVSVERMTLVDRANPSTYSFNTQRCEWKRHGNWLLPFDGEGLYDSQLDAWVGVCDDGFPCACDIPSSCDGDPSDMTPAPGSRVGKEMVFRKRSKIAAEVALARVDNGEFCVVELQPPEGVDVLAVGDDGRRLLHVSVFGLVYNEARELRTINHRCVSYLVPGEQARLAV